MRDSDWSRQNLLRSDWLVPKVASLTTIEYCTSLDFKGVESRIH